MGDRRRADKRDRFDVRVVEQAVDGFLVAVDVVRCCVPENFAAGAGGDVGEMARRADPMAAGEVGVRRFAAAISWAGYKRQLASHYKKTNGPIRQALEKMNFLIKNLM